MTEPTIATRDAPPAFDRIEVLDIGEVFVVKLTGIRDDIAFYLRRDQLQELSAAIGLALE
jgi:hypothetical protein